VEVDWKNVAADIAAAKRQVGGGVVAAAVAVWFLRDHLFQRNRKRTVIWARGEKSVLAVTVLGSSAVDALENWWHVMSTWACQRPCPSLFYLFS
jgi:hypothetical protein